MKLYLTTDEKRSIRSGNYFCGVWCGERPSKDSDGNWAYGNPDDTCLCRWYLPESRLAALGFPPPGEIRVVKIGEYKEGE